MSLSPPFGVVRCKGYTWEELKWGSTVPFNWVLLVTPIWVWHFDVKDLRRRIMVVELSDGGATWHELTRFTGYHRCRDSIYQTTHSAYLADRVMVRLLTAPNMSADAAFYLDADDIRPDYAADDLANGSRSILYHSLLGWAAQQVVPR
ncbi:MAG: hypothetical protein R2932_16745 [Caldilineaceae bacterium]